MPKVEDAKSPFLKLLHDRLKSRGNRRAKREQKIPRKSIKRDMEFLDDLEVLDDLAKAMEVTLPLVYVDDEYVKSLGLDIEVLQSRLKPAPWRYVTRELELEFQQRALLDMGEAYPFVLNLAPGFIEIASKNDKGFVDYLRRSLSRCLKRKLGRTIEFAFQVDITWQGRLHIQGIIGVNTSEFKLTREALKQAVGIAKGVEGEKYQVWIKKIIPDSNWAGYNSRNEARVRRQLAKYCENDNKNKIAVAACSRAVNQRARSTYNVVKDLVVHIRRIGH